MTDPQEENPPFDDPDIDESVDEEHFAPRPDQPAVQDDGQDIHIPDLS